MNKNEIANEIKDIFFSPILIRVLSEVFEESGIQNPENFVKEAINNQSLQSKIKSKLAVGMSEKYTELGLPTTPDDMDIIVSEKGIEAINLKIHTHKESAG